MSRVLGPAIHQAYVYPDFEAALDRFASLGIGPFYVLRGLDGMGRYRGEDHPLSLSVAFAYSGEACFEIMAADSEQQSAYGEFLRRNPTGGLHHIAYYSTDFETTLAALAAEGKPLQTVQEMINPETGERIEIYCEPVGVDNPVLFQLLKPGLFDRSFDIMREAAANWDGADPFRDAAPLMMGAMAEDAA